MTSKYIYKGIDITLDVYEKIRDVSNLLACQDGISFEDAYERFARSHAYESLARPQTLMWSESVPFILDEYRAELAAR